MTILVEGDSWYWLVKKYFFKVVRIYSCSSLLVIDTNIFSKSIIGIWLPFMFILVIIEISFASVKSLIKDFSSSFVSGEYSLISLKYSFNKSISSTSFSSW